MRKVKINKQTQPIYYVTIDDVALHANDPAYALYKSLYDICASICDTLKIKYPYLAITDTAIRRSNNGVCTYSAAITFFENESPELHNNLILISINPFDEKYLTGLLAHEARHIWQHTYNPQINDIPAHGYHASLSHPAEMDADGYAIFYLAHTYSLSLENAGSIVCPDEKLLNPESFLQRIESAKTFIQTMQLQSEQAAHKPPTKRKFWNALFSFIHHNKK